MDLLVDIDAPDSAEAMTCDTRAFGFALARRLGAGVAATWPRTGG
jgi:hypothetical protein